MTKKPPPCKDFYATINLNPNSNEYYQAVYGSQLYGTYFSVFAKFYTLDDKDSNDSSQKTVPIIEFWLMNYKGNIELGLIDVSYNNENEFEINIRALENNHKFTLDRSEDPIIFNKDINDEIVFKRTLHKMTLNGHHKDHVFDSEFYHRDGSLITPKIRLDELNEEQLASLYNNPSVIEILERQGHKIDELEGMSPGCRCILGKAKITF